MTELVLRGCGPEVLLSHLALYGLGAILEARGVHVRIRWSPGSDPRPTVTVPNRTVIGDAVLAHAAKLVGPQSWTHRDVVLNGTSRGLMSPRLTPFGDDQTWSAVQAQRHKILQGLMDAGAWLDLRFLAALGEPAYWSRNRDRELVQDDGASRLEMQPRNQGSEFVGSRLRKVATAVAARQPQQILSGLLGESLRDEAGGDRRNSRTATGFANPGPTDNALAWCTFWGIAQLPIAMRVSPGGTRSNTPAVTSGHLGRGRREWFYAPIWHDSWRLARLRTVLAAQATRVAAATDLSLAAGRVSDADLAAARAWLAARGVEGLIRFPVRRFGSDKAPERRAMRGEPVPVRPGS